MTALADETRPEATPVEDSPAVEPCPDETQAAAEADVAPADAMSAIADSAAVEPHADEAATAPDEIAETDRAVHDEAVAPADEAPAIADMAVEPAESVAETAVTDDASFAAAAPDDLAVEIIEAQDAVADLPTEDVADEDVVVVPPRDEAPIVEAPRDAAALVAWMGRAARAATSVLALAPPEQKNRALREAARALRTNRDEILAANARDLEAASNLSDAMRDRLLLTEDRIEAMARGLITVAGLPDPVGTVLADWTRPNGLHIQRVRVPLGVIGIIYESRPNVTADAGALCLKAGNAAILRGGSESFHSSKAIANCLVDGLRAAGLPATAIQLVPTTDRAAVGAMLSSPELIDVIVPRGGRSLIERVQRESRVPVFAHLEGINHVFVEATADLDKARAIAMNAKMRRVSVCGAMETLLVDRAVLRTHLAPIVHDLLEAGCEVRGDETVRAVDARVVEASEQDWSTEYLEAILSVRVVDGIDEAIRHVNQYGSHHTDAIVTEDEGAAAEFLARIDSGIVLVNASTQFADGGEFGMGAEIGISTGKMHARGPVGAEQLTSYKYLVRGNGQVRP